MKHFKIIIAFAGHIITAVAVFCIVGAAAWALHLVRHWLEAAGLDDVVLIGLHALELLLFTCDLIATGFWSIMSTKKVLIEVSAADESGNDKDSSDDSK
jgi:hypothetical protein